MWNRQYLDEDFQVGTSNSEWRLGGAGGTGAAIHYHV